MGYLRKSVSVLLALIMVVSVFTIVPFTANAAEAITIYNHHWDSLSDSVASDPESVTDYKTLSSNASDLESGIYAVKSNTTASNRLHVSSGETVGLYLGKGATLTCNNGIRVDKGGTLNVYAATSKSGKLSINMNNGSQEKYCAAIGADDGQDAGAIRIHGGTVNIVPKHGNYGAGIGGGRKCSADVVEIWDGDVTCRSDSGYHSYGAAIGGGYKAPVSWKIDGGVYVYGGKVNVKSRTGAGIGNGYYTLGKSRTGSVNVLGGDVTAESMFGAGLGGGQLNSNCEVNISGGKVNAVSTANPDYDGGAAIGSGASADQGGAINISGGSVIATAVEGAGIGSGDEGASQEINITGGTIVSTSVRGGAGIGSGCEGNAAGAITINHANIVANSKNYELGDTWDKAMKDQLGRTNWYSDGEKYYATGLLIVSTLLDWFSCEESGAAIGGGEDGKFSTISIKNSEVSANSGNYAAAIGSGDEAGDGGKIYIENSTVTATSGEDAAAIGGGNECKVDEISIIDCPNVKATSAETAAAIGGGDEKGCDKITISNSNVYAKAGEYGAGIGTGDEAENGSQIHIKNNSYVVAYGGKEGAGIGTGNESDYRADVYISGSTVNAYGGDYAAGIGGGDDCAGGTMNITNSTVNAYGGYDAAGIGGGEGGSGGTITIEDSEVHAQGKHYGAGIGGGEDKGVESVVISGDTTVEAEAGGSGNGVAIGNGDYNSILYSKPSSSITLAKYLRVNAGKKSDTSIFSSNSGVSAVSSNKYAYIEPCPHNHKQWCSVNDGAHQQCCLDCGKMVSGTYESHTWNSDYKCTKCGAEAVMLTVTVVEQDNNGEKRRSYQIPSYSYTTFPECENVPDGKEFVCWKNSALDYDVLPDEGNSFYNDFTLTAVYMDVVQTAYIDENGASGTVKARKLTQSALQSDVLLTDGWYVVDENITSDKHIYVKDNVRLILADGKTLNLTTSGTVAVTVRSNENLLSANHLSVYGQSAGTGTLNCTEGGIRLPFYEQYGGKVDNMYDSFRGNATISGGTFIVRESMSTSSGGKILINGGNVSINSLSLYAKLTLGWTKLSDRIKIDNIDVQTISYYNPNLVFVEDSKALTDGTTVYQGTLSQNEIGWLDGKTLKPYLNHNYGDPRWEWRDCCERAAAVFTCTDDGCGDEQRVEAKMDIKEENNTRTSTAMVEFNGKTYTDTRSTKIMWNINIANCAHGTITANKAQSRAYNEVQLKFTPDEGYVLKDWTVTPEDESQSIETDYNIFRMPECDVTVSAEFVKAVERVEPYIDDNGEYHLGTVKHFEIDGKNYAVNENGTIGDELDSIEFSYFDFEPEGDTYRIKYYTGPTDGLTELVIPKSFNGKPITSLGTDDDDRFMQGDGPKPQFSLVLNENITEIKEYSFYTQDVKEVKGNTSGLNKIGSYAFSWGNSPDNFNIDVKLDYEGTITCGSYIFNHRNVTLRLKHSTYLSKTTPYDLGAQSVDYKFTDAHTYGEPEWKWADDYSSANVTLTCTDSRCKHTEKADATVAKTDELTKTTYTASAELDGVTYTDTKTVNKTLSNITVNSNNHGTVTADKEQAYEGEEVALTITPEEGYKLTSLTVKDSSNKEIEVKDNKFTMPQSDVTVSATFAAKQYAINYSDYDDIWLSGPLYADAGEEVTVFAHPHSGYEITKLTYRDGEGVITEIAGNKFTMPASQIKIYATFRKATYNITYQDDGHGTVSGAATAQFNDRVPITVTPDEGYILNNLYADDDEWGDPANIIDDNGYVLIMSDTDVKVCAEFIPYTPASEPYIDENGEYHLGNVAYYDAGDGTYFAVENGKLGEQLDSVELSYFDFTENGNTYQINYYCGPTENLTELVIPKTFKGKPITVLGTDNRNAFVPNSNPKPQFTLTLNENIREIKGYAFYTMWVEKVQGDTSSLSKIGKYAFSWANSIDDYSLDIKLDYVGTIDAGYEMFNHMKVAARIKHATKFSRSSFSQQSINYIFADSHTYGEPEWIWADDYSSAKAKFTCTDTRCNHKETVDAVVTSTIENGKAVMKATASLDGVDYTDTKSPAQLNLVYTYNVYDETTGDPVSKTITKQVNAADFTVPALVEINRPYIKSAYYAYGSCEYELNGNTVNVTIPNTDKKYTVTLDGKNCGEYGYLETATINLDEDKAFVVDGKVVYIGKRYSFYVGGNTELSTEDPTSAVVAEYAKIDLNSYIIDGDKVSLEMLATANAGESKYERMGVAFALSNKSEDEIASAVQDIKTGNGTSNKIYVHNSKVDWYNQSGQYQFRYAPYFNISKAKNSTIYFYTYVLTDDGVKISPAATYNMSNLLA